MAISLEFVPRLLPAPQAAHYLGVSASTLRLLPIVRKKIGSKRLYDKHDLDAYADSLPYENATNTCDGVFGKPEHEGW